jgi:hypothetical protein
LEQELLAELRALAPPSSRVSVDSAPGMSAQAEERPTPTTAAFEAALENANLVSTAVKNEEVFVAIVIVV